MVRSLIRGVSVLSLTKECTLTREIWRVRNPIEGALFVFCGIVNAAAMAADVSRSQTSWSDKPCAKVFV